YGDYDKLYANFYASGYDQAATPNQVTLDGYVDTTQRQNLILSGNLIAELDTGSVHHTMIFGGEMIDTSSNQDRWNTFWSTTSDDNEIFAIARPLNVRGGIGVNAEGAPTTNDFTADINDDTRVDIKVLSAYIQDEIELTDWLHVIIGGRFDSFDIDVDNVVAGTQRSRKDSEFSPRAGLILKPQSNISLYASYSESFLPRSGEQFANINGDNDALAPNTFTNLEAGLKWDFAPDLSFTAAVFEIEQSSPQIDDSDSSAFVIVDSKIQGFELQLQGEIMDRWNVSAGYSYLDGEQVNQSGGTGLRPRELPKHTLSLWNAYEIGDRFGLGLGMTYQSASFVNNSNSATLPSYVRVDASAFYDVSDNVRIQVNVENMLDELYFPSSHSTHQVTVGAPVNARFAISARF
ncbi:MAG: TonB-dependent receptor, partial [Marinomonas sp.]